SRSYELRASQRNRQSRSRQQCARTGNRFGPCGNPAAFSCSVKCHKSSNPSAAQLQRALLIASPRPAQFAKCLPPLRLDTICSITFFQRTSTNFGGGGLRTLSATY